MNTVGTIHYKGKHYPRAGMNFEIRDQPRCLVYRLYSFDERREEWRMVLAYRLHAEAVLLATKHFNGSGEDFVRVEYYLPNDLEEPVLYDLPVPADEDKRSAIVDELFRTLDDFARGKRDRNLIDQQEKKRDALYRCNGFEPRDLPVFSSSVIRASYHDELLPIVIVNDKLVFLPGALQELLYDGADPTLDELKQLSALTRPIEEIEYALSFPSLSSFVLFFHSLHPNPHLPDLEHGEDMEAPGEVIYVKMNDASPISSFLLPANALEQRDKRRGKTTLRALIREKSYEAYLRENNINKGDEYYIEDFLGHHLK